MQRQGDAGPLHSTHSFIPHASPSACPLPGIVLGGRRSAAWPLRARSLAKETTRNKTHRDAWYLDRGLSRAEKAVYLKVLVLSHDFVQRLGRGVTRGKEVIFLALTNKQADTTPSRNYLAPSNKLVRMHPYASAVPLLGVGSQQQIAHIEALCQKKTLQTNTELWLMDACYSI